METWTFIDYVKIISICLLWYFSSACVSIIGKMILSDFPYPMTLTMVQLLTMSVLLSPFLPCVGASKIGSYTRRYFFVMILPLAFGKFISSFTTYISIWRVSVSYAHTVKATLPLFTVVLAKIILGETHTLSVYLSLLPIIVGVGVATMTEVTFDSIGLTFALISTVCFCLLTIYSKKCLKDTGYHHLQLLLLISRIATAAFLPFWTLTDLPSILYNTEFAKRGQALHTLFLLLCNGFFNMLHNVFAFTVLAHVTPLSYAIANATKRIVIISGSILVLQNTVSPLNVVGMLIAVFGVLSYNKAKYNQIQAARRQRVLPYVHSDSNLKHLGVHHMPHSKSDANFFTNGDLAHPHNTGSRLPSGAPIDEHGVGEGILVPQVGGMLPLESETQEASDSSPVEIYFHSPSEKIHSRGVHQM